MFKIVLITSAFVGLIAVFCTFETFTPYRKQLLNFFPEPVKLYFDFGSENAKIQDERLLTKEQLKRFTGENNRRIYIALLGKVFDVSTGKKHYGPNGGYSFFAGRDGTRAFITGDFTEKGLIEDINGLSLQELLGIDGWLKFYEKDYKYVGKLIGLYYDKYGQPTEALAEYNRKLKEAQKEEDNKKEDMIKFPPCNSEYKQGQGRRFWCTQLSGGIQRDWVGVPRQYYQPGQANPRCACVRTTGPPTDDPQRKNHKNNGDLDHPKMKLYENCDPNSESCSFPE